MRHQLSEDFPGLSVIDADAKDVVFLKAEQTFTGKRSDKPQGLSKKPAFDKLAITA